MPTDLSTIDNLAKPKNQSKLMIINRRNDPVVIYLKSLQSEASQITMAKLLFIFARWYLGAPASTPQDIAWSDIDSEVIQNYQSYLSKVKRHEPATVNTYFNAVKGVLRKSARIKRVEPVNKISLTDFEEILEIKSIRGSRTSKGKSLNDDQVSKVLKSCEEKTLMSVRDKAILSVFIYCGLRLNEMCEIKYPDCLSGSGTLTIIGKGNKERIIPLHPIVSDALEEWIAEVRGEHVGYMFHRIWRTGEVNELKGLTDSGFRKILTKRTAVLGFKITPHDLRRTFGTRLLEKGADLLLVRDLLGHSSVDTTATYDLRGIESKRDAVLML
jgi:integrase/recombinase XerD